MEFKVKKIFISSGGPLVCVLNSKDADKLILRALDRVKLKKGRKEIVAIVDITHDSYIKKGEVGLFEEVIKVFNVKDKEKIVVEHQPSPRSLKYIRKKLDGKKLSKHDVDEIVGDIITNRLSEIEMTYFTSGVYTHGLTLYESVYLTEAIVASGKQLDIDAYPICDKHAIGGVPGNRTTPIVVSIVAAAGFTIPKTSTRSITSVSGTADTVEVLAPVTHNIDDIKKIVKKTGACIVWGGTLELASADDKLIKIERPLGLDPEGFLLASILAKKAAVKATHILIDIPIGKGAKIEDKKKAKALERKFEQLGKLLGMNTNVIITDGTQPIGNGIGPALEARDILLVLQNRGPKDLKEKSVKMAGLLLKMVGVKNSKKKALELLESGMAYKKFKEIIKAQGGNPDIKPEQINIGKYKYNFKAVKKGKISYIDNKMLTRVAKLAGAPESKGTGVYLNVHLKDKVKKGDIVFTLYAEDGLRLKDAVREIGDKIVLIDEKI